MSNKNIPDHYRIPPGAEDILGAIHPSTPHMIASSIEWLFRAGRKPGNTMALDVRKAQNMLRRWLEENDPAPEFPTLAADAVVVTEDRDE